MTNEELADALEEVSDRITDGDWYWWMSEGPPFDVGNSQGVYIGIHTGNGADAEFICTIRNHLPRVIEALRSHSSAE